MAIRATRTQAALGRVGRGDFPTDDRIRSGQQV